jgi:hypothetical protein
LWREEEVEDTSDGVGHDSEEEEPEQEPEQEKEEEHEEGGTTKGRSGTTRTRWWRVTDLLQDPHPHANTGLATSFALL